MARPIIKKSVGKTRPKIIKQEPVVTKPTVFHDHHRRIFLFLTENNGYNRYLTTKDEEFKVVKLSDGEPERDRDGHLLDDTTCISELFPTLDGSKKLYDMKKAAQSFYDSFVVKTPEAVRELCKILGKPIPKPSDEEVTKHDAKVERFKRVRVALTIARKEKAVGKERQVMTTSGFPTSAAIVTTVKGATAALDEPRKAVMSALKKAGGSQSAGELRKAVGKPIGNSIMKLVELGLVTLS